MKKIECDNLPPCPDAAVWMFYDVLKPYEVSFACADHLGRLIVSGNVVEEVEQPKTTIEQAAKHLQDAIK